MSAVKAVSFVLLTTLTLALGLVGLYPSHALQGLKPRAEAWLNARLTGSVRIGELEASSASRLVVHDVTLFDSDGRSLLTVERLGVSWKPYRLLQERVHLTSVELNGANLHRGIAAEQIIEAVSWNATQGPDDGPKPTTALPVAVILDSFRASDLRLGLPGPLGLKAAGKLGVGGGLVAEVVVRHLEDRVQLSVSDAEVFAASATLRVEGSLSAGTVGRWVEVRCPLALRARAHRSAADERWRTHARLHLGDNAGRLSVRSTWSAELQHRDSALRARFDSSGGCIPSLPRGSLEADAIASGALSAIAIDGGIEIDGLSYDRWAAGDARAKVRARREAKHWRVELPRLSWNPPEHPPLTGRLGFAELGTQWIRVHRLELQSEADQIWLSARFSPEATLSSGSYLRAHLHLPQLSRWAEFSPVPVSGTLRADADLEVDSKIVGAAEITAEDLEVSGHGPFKLEALVHGNERFASLEASAEGSSGRAIIDARSRWDALRSSDRLDWARLARSSKVTVELTEVTLAPWTDLDPLRRATVEGELRWVRDHARWDVQAAPIRVVGLESTATLSGESRPGTSRARLRIEDEAGAQARLTLTAPRGPLSLLEDPLHPYPLELDVEVDDLAGGSLHSIGLPDNVDGSIAGELHGTVNRDSCELELRATIHSTIAVSPTLEFDSALRATFAMDSASMSLIANSDVDASVGGHLRAIDTEFRAHSDSGASSANLELELARGTLSMTASTPNGWRELRTMAPGDVPFSADARISDLRLDRALAGTALGRETTGSLTASAHLRSEPEAGLFGSGWARVDGAIINGVVFRELAGELEHADDRSEAKLTIEGSRNGAVEASLVHRPGEAARAKLRARHFSLDWVPRLSETLGIIQSVSGTLDADLEALISDEPALDGQVRIREGTAKLWSGLPRLRKMMLHGDFRGDRARLELRAAAGDGHLGLSLEREGLVFGDFEGELRASDVPVVLNRLLLENTAQIRIEGAVTRDDARLEAHVARGEIDILRMDTSQLHSAAPPEDVVYLEPGNRPSPLDEERGANLAPPFTFNFAVDTETPISVSGERANGSVTADFSGHVEDGTTTLAGTVSAPEGRVELGPYRYTIERAIVRFEKRREVNPNLDVTLVHRFRAPPVDFMIHVAGTSRNPNIELTSNPGGYDQSQLVGFFLGGSPGSSAQAEIGTEAAATALAGVVVSEIQGGLERKLPIDTIDVNIGQSGRASSITTGKWLGPDLYVAYTLSDQPLSANSTATSQDSSAPAHIGLLRYRLSPEWMIEVRVQPGDQAAGSSDLVWVKEF